MWQVLGQNKIINTLKFSLLEGHLSHAYLFVGSKHVGKMTLAINFAQALNCDSEDRPCGECHTCSRIDSGNHPDIQVIQLSNTNDDQASSRKSISVEQIRDLQYSVNLKPYEGGYRIIIIDGAEHMSESAANSLLKTLEEPPPNTVFILLAVDENSLLSTILSRCQKFELLPLPVKEVRQSLVQQWGIPEEHAELLARACHGNIGWAIMALNDENLIEERALDLANFIELGGDSIVKRFEFASDLATRFGKNRLAVREQLELWLTWWRDVLMMKTDCSQFITNIQLTETIQKNAMQFSTSAIAGAIRAIQETIQQLEQNANPRLALEVLMLNIPTAERELNHA